MVIDNLNEVASILTYYLIDFVSSCLIFFSCIFWLISVIGGYFIASVKCDVLFAS